jgi:hypothetical protein
MPDMNGSLIHRLGRKGIILFWLVWTIDFVTSAFFILKGYSWAEQNVSQRALFENPSLQTFLDWLVGQWYYFTVGILGLLFFCSKKISIESLKPALLVFVLGLILIRLYGVASNTGFILQLYGFGLPFALVYLVLLIVAMVPFIPEIIHRE